MAGVSVVSAASPTQTASLREASAGVRGASEGKRYPSPATPPERDPLDGRRAGDAQVQVEAGHAARERQRDLSRTRLKLPEVELPGGKRLRKARREGGGEIEPLRLRESRSHLGQQSVGTRHDIERAARPREAQLGCGTRRRQRPELLGKLPPFETIGADHPRKGAVAGTRGFIARERSRIEAEEALRGRGSSLRIEGLPARRKKCGGSRQRKKYAHNRFFQNHSVRMFSQGTSSVSLPGCHSSIERSSWMSIVSFVRVSV